MTRLALLLPALLAVAACGSDDPPAAAPPTTAAEVADRMVARFDANAGSVSRLTVYGGGARGAFEIGADTLSMDRVRRTVSQAGAAPVMPAAQLLDAYLPNVLRLAQGLRGAEFRGQVTRDGRPAYLLATEDPSGIVGASDAAPEGTQEFRLYIDPETYDVIEIFQSFTPDSATAPFVSQVIYSDFREVDGVRLPFAIRQVSSGLNQDLDEGQKVVAGGQLGLSRSQIVDQMPEGPERDARLAEIDAELRRINAGVIETVLAVDSVSVGPQR